MGLPQQPPSLQGLLSNAWGDLGNVVRGVTQLPQTLLQAGTQAAQHGPAQALLGPGAQMLNTPTGQAVVQGLGNEYNDLLGQPVRDGGIHLPDIGKVGQHLYQHPVQSALDVLPFVHGAGAADAADIGSQAGMTPSEATIVSPLTKSAAPEAGGISDAAAQTYLKGYTIPRWMAAESNPLETARTMIRQGITGAPAQVGAKTQQLIDFVENIKKDALGRVRQPIDISHANTTGTEILRNSPDLAGKGAEASRYKIELNKMFPDWTQDAQGNIGGVNPLDAYDAMKAIRNKGIGYIDQATDAQGKITNFAKASAGQAFKATAEEIRQVLNGSLKNQNILDVYKDPNGPIMQTLGKINPQFAQEFAHPDIQTFEDLQGLQAPHVQMNKIVDESARYGNTAATQLGGSLKQGVGAGLGAAVGSVFGPPGAAVGAAAGGLFEPAIEAKINQVMPAISSKLAGSVDTLGSLPGAVGDVAKGVAPSLPLLNQSVTLGGSNQGNQPNANDNNSNNQHDASLTPGSSRYQTPPLPQGFMNGKDYAEQTNALTQQIANIGPNDPNTTAQLQGKLQQLKTSWDTQQPIRDTWSKTNQTTGLASSAFNIINTADPSILNLNGSYDNLLRSTNPRYAALGVALQQIQQITGVNLSQAKTKEALLSALDSAVLGQNNNFNVAQQQYFGGTLPTPTSNGAQANLPAIQSIQQPQQNLPAVPPSFNFGTAGQGATSPVPLQ